MTKYRNPLELVEQPDIMELNSIFKYLSKHSNKLYILLNVEVPNEQLTVFVDLRDKYFGEVKAFANTTDATHYMKLVCKEAGVPQKYMKIIDITISDLIDIGHKLGENEKDGIIITLNRMTNEGLLQVDTIWDHKGN